MTENRALRPTIRGWSKNSVVANLDQDQRALTAALHLTGRELCRRSAPAATLGLEELAGWSDRGCSAVGHR